ncbi:MAG: hypothetical protein R3B09_04850 [Nannocystaceae bacterium]
MSIDTVMFLVFVLGILVAQRPAPPTVEPVIEDGSPQPDRAGGAPEVAPAERGPEVVG